MLEIFRRNLFVNILLIIPYLVLIRISTFIKPISTFHEYEGNSILVSAIYSLLELPLVQSLVAFILVLIQALILNSISIRNRMAAEATLFTAIAYVLMMGISLGLAGMHPILFANLFLILALVNAIAAYKNTDAVGNIFITGFFIALASIFHPPMVFFILWGFIALMILHSFKWREKFQYISGVIVAYYLLYGFIFYFSDQIGLATSNFYYKIGFIQWKTILISEYIDLIVFTFLFLIAFFSYNIYSQKKRVEVQKYIDVLFWFLAFCIPTVFFTKNIQIHSAAMMAPALALLIGINMTQTKYRLVLEIIHILILGLIIFNHFFTP